MQNVCPDVKLGHGEQNVKYFLNEAKTAKVFNGKACFINIIFSLHRILFSIICSY